MERLVVIGGDAAGMSGASQARRLRDADDLEIIAFERGPFTSYSACGIPYWVSGMIEDRDALIARTPERFRDRYDIQVHTRTEVVKIDTDQREVTVHDLDSDELSQVSYDQLLVATGATPQRPPVPGLDHDGVLGVQTLEHGQHLLDVLERREPRTAVVIGAGYIGIEMAEAMKLRGIEVTVLDRAPQPMASLDPALGEMIADAMREMGISVHLEIDVERVEAGPDGWVQAVITSAGTFEADLVVLGTGTRPNADLAAAAEIPVGPSGGIRTDRQQRTSVEGVWAAGDCAETFHRVSQQPVSIALGTIANKQGRVAGSNLGGRYLAFPGVLGTAVTRVCQIEIGRTGLSERDAGAAGFEVVTAQIEALTRAGYYPGTKPITIRTVAERGSGRLLGAQIVGEEGAAKRIDVFATAIWNEMTVDDLSFVDLSYAPPFAPVWDPVLIAARQASNAVAADL